MCVAAAGVYGLPGDLSEGHVALPDGGNMKENQHRMVRYQHSNPNTFESLRSRQSCRAPMLLRQASSSQVTHTACNTNGRGATGGIIGCTNDRMRCCDL